MDKKQESKINMYQAVYLYLTTNASAYSTNAPLTAAVTAYSNNLNTLVGYIEDQEVVSSGVTLDKKQLRLATENLSMQVANGIMAYATSQSNNTLSQNAKVTPSEMNRFSDNALIG